MPKKNKDATYYAEKFNEFITAKQPIINQKTREILVPKEDEIFLQCYAETPLRAIFPKYWYISNYANLISVGENGLRWVKKNERETSGRYFYMYTIQGSDGKKHLKNIETHNLTWLVHGAGVYGEARRLLKENGIEAFGVKNKEELKVNGHHKDGIRTNNHPSNGKFVTTNVHPLLECVPSPDADAEKQLKYMEKLSQVLSEEEPENISLLITGQTVDSELGTWSDNGYRDVAAVHSIKMSEQALKELNTILGKIFYKK